ncbi:MAG: hypothetical protein IJY15_13975 [Thermoguttaceae bacterium]|nr:hypothetical protein [Thermoguttaceae bacterium]
MNSPLIKVRAGAYDVVAVDGRIRVVRRRDGAAVGSLPLVDEPTFGDALKEAVSRAASAKSRPSVAVSAAPPEEPKKKRRARPKTKPTKTVDPAPASVAPNESPALAAPEPIEPAVENLEKTDNEET